MKFKTGENMPVEAADDLRQAGHDAVTVADRSWPVSPMFEWRTVAGPGGGWL